MKETNFSQLIDNYLSGELSAEDMNAVHNLIESDPLIREEFELQSTLHDALSETDILELRQNLSMIAGNYQSGSMSEPTFSLQEEKALRDLADKQIEPKILVNFYSALPKLHLINHNHSVHENLHLLYQEQQQAGEFDPVLMQDNFEDDLPEGLGEAILEQDIMNLRENLMKISATLTNHDYSVEEIDKYVSSELRGKNLADFESELAHNPSLRADVGLMRELDVALDETDIIALRKNLSLISESHITATIDQEVIEQYVTDELPSEKYIGFEKEYVLNPGLRAEVGLSKAVNEAIGEKDIIDMRGKLRAIRENLGETDVHPAAIRASGRNIRKMIASAAAVALILLGLGGVVRNMPVKPDAVYESSYAPYPSSSPPRAASISQEELAFRKYENKQYAGALEIFSSLSQQNERPGHRFYMGQCYQALGDDLKAIGEYKSVISDGNSLFVGLAEWYLSLCYLRTGEIENARQHLLAIVERKDHYAKDAQTALRRIKQFKR